MSRNDSPKSKNITAFSEIPQGISVVGAQRLSLEVVSLNEQASKRSVVVTSDQETPVLFNEGTGVLDINAQSIGSSAVRVAFKNYGSIVVPEVRLEDCHDTSLRLQTSGNHSKSRLRVGRLFVDVTNEQAGSLRTVNIARVGIGAAFMHLEDAALVLTDTHMEAGRIARHGGTVREEGVYYPGTPVHWTSADNCQENSCYRQVLAADRKFMPPVEQ